MVVLLVGRGSFSAGAQCLSYNLVDGSSKGSSDRFSTAQGMNLKPLGPESSGTMKKARKNKHFSTLRNLNAPIDALALTI